MEFKFLQICRGTDNVCISRVVDTGSHTEMPHIIFHHFRMYEPPFIPSDSSALQYPAATSSYENLTNSNIPHRVEPFIYPFERM